MNKIFIVDDQPICHDCLLHVQTSEKAPPRAAEGQRCSICSKNMLDKKVKSNLTKI